jgi:hypothetical protein
MYLLMLDSYRTNSRPMIRQTRKQPRKIKH